MNCLRKIFAGNFIIAYYHAKSKMRAAAFMRQMTCRRIFDHCRRTQTLPKWNRHEHCHRHAADFFSGLTFTPLSESSETSAGCPFTLISASSSTETAMSFAAVIVPSLILMLHTVRQTETHLYTELQFFNFSRSDRIIPDRLLCISVSKAADIAASVLDGTDISVNSQKVDVSVDSNGDNNVNTITQEQK